MKETLRSVCCTDCKSMPFIRESIRAGNNLSGFASQSVMQNDYVCDSHLSAGAKNGCITNSSLLWPCSYD